MPSADSSKGQATKIDIGDLTETVTESVQRALLARGQQKFPGRIIIGIIIEPQDVLRQAAQ